jgi:AcrR family transcriptional regulator
MKPEPAKSYHHKDLRRALVEQAALALAAGGSQAVSLRDLAREIGVSHSAPLRHFPTREALLAALAIQGFRQLTAAMERAVQDSASANLGTALQHAGTAYVVFAAAHPHLFRLMFTADRVDAASFPALLEAGEACKAALTNWVSQAVQAGDMVGSSPEMVGLACWAMVHGMAFLAIDGQVVLNSQADVQAVTANLLATLSEGIGRKG